MKWWKWFKDCKTFKEGKKKYRELVMEYHPDRGGTHASDEAMKEISNEYQQFLQVAVPEEEQKHEDDGSAKYEFTNRFYTQLSEVSMLNVEVEIIGEWIWVWDWSPMDIISLVAMNFVYSKKYGGWFWFDPARPPKGRAPEDWNAQTMRDKFGSKEHQKRRFI